MANLKKKMKREPKDGPPKKKKKLHPRPAEGGEPQHVILLSHVPYGFFEKEMHGYFSQFGDIKRVRVIRNKKTGNHTGTAFVEFRNAEVAKIAADTMNNYLLAENRLRCRVVKPDLVPNTIRRGPLFVKIPKPGESRLKHAKTHSKEKTPTQEWKQIVRFVNGLRQKMHKIEQQGIDYKFDFDAKLATFLRQNEGKMEDKEVEEMATGGKKIGKKEEMVEMELGNNLSATKQKTR